MPDGLLMEVNEEATEAAAATRSFFPAAWPIQPKEDGA
jgi:hypothetical protein